MKFEVTTIADEEMGNPVITIEADTPAAAEQFHVRACDYFCDDADSHVGEPVTVIVTAEDGEETRIAATYA